MLPYNKVSLQGTISFPFFISILGACIAGLAPLFVRLSEVGSTATGFYRFFLSIPLLALWMIWSRNKEIVVTVTPSKNLKDYLLIILAGTLFGIDIAMWNYSIMNTSIANASMLANLSSIYVALVGWLFFKEKLSLKFLSGLIIAFAGSCLLIGVNLDFQTNHFLGDFCALMASVTFGTYMLVMRELRKKFAAAFIMTFSATVSAIVLFIIGKVMGDVFMPSSSYGWIILFCLAWITMVMGHGLISWAAAHVPPSLSTMGMLLQPAVSAIGGWILFNERLGWDHCLGMGAIMIGVAIAQLSNNKTA